MMSLLVVKTQLSDFRVKKPGLVYFYPVYQKLGSFQGQKCNTAGLTHLHQPIPKVEL
jgi:hypothetical protein